MTDRATVLFLVIGLALLGTASHAGARDEFERRSLIPFKAKTLIITDGLTEGTSALVKVIPDTQNFAGCMVLGLTDVAPDTAATVMRDRMAPDMLGQLFHSTDWRQPGLRVTVGTASDPGAPGFTVFEKSHD